MKTTWLTALLAALLFIPLFIFQEKSNIDFWWSMSAIILILITIAHFSDNTFKFDIIKDLQKNLLKKIGIGLLTAAGLYIIFYFGNQVSQLIFDFAKSNIENVYSFKGDSNPLKISLLMLLIIGPGEELFWRGFLQKRLQKHNGKIFGYILASTVYTLIHVGSGNLMLVLAAAVCGFFWGFLYMRTHSITINLVSHTVWDLAIFILFPMN